MSEAKPNGTCLTCDGEGSIERGDYGADACKPCKGTGCISPSKSKDDDVERVALVGPLITLTRYNIPPDIQDLLVSGNPERGVPPGALRAALSSNKEDEVTEEKLPEALPGHWSTVDGQKMATDYLGKGREDLCHGEMSDMELANAIFLVDRFDLGLTRFQTAAKERIRWLSAQLAMRGLRP